MIRRTPTDRLDARLAATVMLLRDVPDTGGIEVFIQERADTMPNYPNVVVFPGGGVDKRDLPNYSDDLSSLWSGRSRIEVARQMKTTVTRAHAIYFAAVRELFEETGTLLAVDENGEKVLDASSYHAERLELVSKRSSLSEVFHRHNLKIRSDLLMPIDRWVGTSDKNTRFDVMNFVARRPTRQEPDGNNSETKDWGWFTPEVILRGWRNRYIKLALNTWYQIKELSQFASVSEALECAAQRQVPTFNGDDYSNAIYAEFFGKTKGKLL